MLPQVELACKILDGSCFRDDPSKMITVQVPRPSRSSIRILQEQCVVQDR